MIVRAAGSSLVLITQPDHAALARRMMDHWVARGFAATARRASILHAIAEHDNGWREVDTAPIIDESGRLLDFVTAPLEVRQGIWPRGARRLAANPAAAALVAEHAIHIYRRLRDDAAWTTFFGEMEAQREEFAAAAGLSLDVVARDYFFLRVADLMSLTFCNAWTEPQEMDGCVMRLDGDTLTVRPDPFGGSTVPLAVPGRLLPNRAFASAREAAELFRAASPVVISGLARGT